MKTPGKIFRAKKRPVKKGKEGHRPRPRYLTLTLSALPFPGPPPLPPFLTSTNIPSALGTLPWIFKDSLVLCASVVQWLADLATNLQPWIRISSRTVGEQFNHLVILPFVLLDEEPRKSKLLKSKCFTKLPSF